MLGSLASSVASPVGRLTPARHGGLPPALTAALPARHALGGREARTLADCAARVARRTRSARREVTAGVGSFFGGRRGQNQPSEEPAVPVTPAIISIKKALLSVPALELGTLKQGVSDDCLGAMQRTVSGMLGLLQPEQFKIRIECTRESLHRLLTSAVMTGFTLHNVEDRLTVARSLELSLGTLASDCPPAEQLVVPQPSDADFQQTPSSVHKYLVSLEQRLKQMEKERDAALAPRPAPAASAGGANALMTYLKSLEESQVAALSKPKSQEVEDAVRALVDSLVGRLPPARSPARTEANFPGLAQEQVHAPPHQHELSTSFAVSREYLESLILWCMCMGHYARSLEHRQELQRHMSLHDGADILPLSARDSLNSHDDSS